MARQAAASPRTDLKQYFTDAVEISAAMALLLGDVDGKTILEPSVGSGSLLAGLHGHPSRIDAIDVDPAILALARQRVPALPVRTHRADFIDIHLDDAAADAGDAVLSRDYDAVIANPPFGLPFSQDYRRRLKRRFPDLYVRESFGLFFILAVSLLKPGGRFCFLLPDTFLISRNHAPLRRFICRSAAVTTIVRFPSRRFGTVNFGYANLCLVAGTRTSIADSDRIDWIDAFDDECPLLEQPVTNIEALAGHDLRRHADSGWHKGMARQRAEYPDWSILGDLAECRTGIYTGDNARFVGYDPVRINRRRNGHAIQWDSDLHPGGLSAVQRQYGIDGPPVYVPLIRGGHRRFDEATAWAIRWDAASVASYRDSRKARFQNADFYFRQGLAVPMVTSRRLSASLMDTAVFDQGVVGVFPHHPGDRHSLLLYLNSSIATRFRNDIVNGSANSSANYLKRLPAPRFSNNDRARASRIVDAARERGSLTQTECDDYIHALVA